MYQPHLLDKTPLELWGNEETAVSDPRPRAADAGGGPCPVCDKFTTHLFCSRECAVKYKAIKEQEEQAKKKPAPTSCIQCGKASAGMFCDSKCRTAWKNRMEKFSKKIIRTKLVGADEIKLF